MNTGLNASATLVHAVVEWLWLLPQVNDRVSASIVYSGMARTGRSLPGWAPGSMRLFSQSKGGVVVSSRVVVDSLLCSYATDAGSRERQCPPQSGRMLDRACVPGCLCARHPRWCNPSTADLSGWCDGAAWRPGDLAAMLAVEQSYNYNELVLDAAGKWMSLHMPGVACPRPHTPYLQPRLLRVHLHVLPRAPPPRLAACSSRAIPHVNSCVWLLPTASTASALATLSRAPPHVRC